MEMNSVFWIKMLGCLMIFAGCTGLGLRLSGRLAERQRALSKLQDILLNLKNQMCGLGIPLTTAFENIGKDCTGGVWSDVFTQCGKVIREQHLDPGAAWKQTIQNAKGQLPFDESGLNGLADFGEMLGKSDRMNQESVLDMEKQKIAVMEKVAREAMDTRGKLYRNLGALTGAAVVILLI